MAWLTIRGLKGGMLCEIIFSRDDLIVALCCTDGYLIIYDIKEKKETMIHHSKNNIFFGCHINSNEDVVEYGSDMIQNGVIRHIVKNEIIKTVQVHTARLISGFCFPNGNLVVGTEDGIIKLMLTPLSEKPCFELNAHMGPIGRLLVSPDRKRAFTCGEDGAIFVYNLALTPPDADQSLEEFLSTSAS